MMPLKIRDIPTETRELTIVGSSPLLVRAWYDVRDVPRDYHPCPYNDLIARMHWLDSKPEYAGDDDTAAERFESAAKVARFGFPASGIARSIRFAEPVSRGKKPGHPPVRTMMEMFFVTEDDFCEIVGSRPVAQEFDVKIGRKVERALFGQFDEWSMTLKLTMAKGGQSGFDDVLNLTAIAGESVGIGAMRPEMGGRYGRFVVA